MALKSRHYFAHGVKACRENLWKVVQSLDRTRAAALLYKGGSAYNARVSALLVAFQFHVTTLHQPP